MRFPKMKKHFLGHFLAGFTFCLLAAALLNAQTNVVTWHYDIARDGLNPNETVLTQTTVTPSQFGKICSAEFDGQIYGEPLVVNNGSGNVVYVGTMNGSMYAINGTNCSQINYISLLGPGEIAVPCTTVGGASCQTVKPIISILGTPVVDLGTNTIFVVAESESMTGTCPTKKVNACFIHRLHALDLTTFAEKFNGPVEIAGSYAGVAFTSKNHIQRPGLLELPGIMPNGDDGIYIGFSEMDGTGVPGVSIPRGWIFNFDAENLTAIPNVWTSTPAGEGGGVWMAGAGLAAGPTSPGGPTYIYFATGDGDFTVNNGGSDYGESFIAMTPSLQVAGYFTPFAAACMDPSDTDFGSGGVMLMPQIGSTYYGIAAGKDKNIYAMNLASPGGFTPPTNSTCPATGTNANAQYFLGGSGHQYFTTPVMWSSYLYYVPMNAAVVKYSVNQIPPGTCSTSPICQAGTNTSKIVFNYGTNPSISSNMENTGTAVLWANYQNGWPAAANPSPAVLHAFDAEHVTLPHTVPELWNSTMCPTRDKQGNSTKFVVPTVANGYVYISSMNPNDTTNTQGQLDVFGQTSATCQ
jgi:hypothetical protein